MLYQNILKVAFAVMISLYGLCAGAQTKTITGQVVEDSTGAPVPGVTIKVKNGPQSAVTNLQGNFTMNISSQGATLQYTHVGYQYGEIVVNPGDTKPLVITVKKLEVSMDDVVVIGYGSQKRENLTGSVATVDMGKISDFPVSSIAEALKGQIPGLNVTGGSQRPGDNALLSVRQQFGFSKDGSSPLPLIIIDDVIQLDPSSGLPTMDQFNVLDPSEVESITVLRDASAAIYGSRASQGAIIVKTKKGKAGAPKISYSGKFEFNDAVSFGKTMSAYEHGIFANRFFRADGRDAKSLFDENELEAMKSLNYDWLKEAWKPGGAMQHSLNVSGGSDRATYFAGAGYYTQRPNLGSQDYNKWSFRTGVDVKVVNNLKLSATVSANNSKVEKSFTKISVNDGSYTSGSEQTDYAILAHMPKYIPWQYTVDGVTEYISPALGPHRAQSSPAGQNNITGWNYFGLLNNGSFTSDDDQAFNTNFSLQYNVPFIKGLAFKVSYGLSYSTANNEQAMMGLRLAVATNAGNAIGYHLYTDSSSWKVANNDNRSTVRYADEIGKVEQSNFFINYDNKFGKHNISAMASVEKGQQSYQKKFIIYDQPIMGAYNGSSPSAGTLNPSNTYVNRTEGGNLAYLGRLNYDYDNKYLLQFVFRSDASTKFAPVNYWGFFPGVSAGWVISREKWFNDRLDWVNFLKLRVSVGRTGNDNVKPWRWMQTYGYAADKGLGFGTNNGGRLVSGLTPDATPNPDVTWDKTVKKNIGIDASFLNNRLSVTYDRYWDNKYDMLMTLANQVGVPISVGGGFAEQNFGGLRAWGSEFSATWKDRVGDFGYNIGVNFGTGDNKVTKWLPVAFNYPSEYDNREGYSTLQPTYGFLTWKGNAGGDGILRTDADIDAYWKYLTDRAIAAGTTPSYLGFDTKDGLKKGMLAYQDLGGQLDAATETIAGPNGRIEDDGQDFTTLGKRRSFGLATNIGLSWRSFTLNTQIATSWGGFNRIDYIKQGTGSTQLFWSHESYLNDMYSAEDNVNGRWPNLAYIDQNQYESDFWQISSFRSYVRSLVIGYSVPKNIAAKVKMDALRISLAGFNLWDFHNPYPDKYRNMYDDPQVAYPTLRTWSLGINASF
ncbi:SusC/RagA family TonB-linked outer membrane protein [Niabella beijingensis]|uniref:SusC/RagA family TonB-linked outer membrane protein n=1 Tax=Niabella beijingensis TaxID=2872700 RepID=UPI001CBF0331|nr:SusC/RagA family TonB-linked outer membrane protein [Niabella beijingensis]MBZ4188064.1 SusC/RagA family TonB-linked outer membrane protein [Niabella beijingensis]